MHGGFLWGQKYNLRGITPSEIANLAGHPSEDYHMIIKNYVIFLSYSHFLLVIFDIQLTN